jgi:pimeloyl-ACP methyl ester carboxylesterase
MECRKRRLGAVCFAFLFLLTPAFAQAEDVHALIDVKTGGVTIHDGDTLTRTKLSSVESAWTFHFTWPSFVPNARARLLIFKGTFGNVEGGVLEEGINYSSAQQQWPAEETFIAKTFSLPALGDHSTPSATYTAVIADAADLQGLLDWFSSGGTSGIGPANYSSLVFNYVAEDNPENLTAAIQSVSYRGITLHEGSSLYRDDLPVLDTSPNNLDQYWDFNFSWTNNVSNQQALFMIFRGTFGHVEGDTPLDGVNYAFNLQSWTAGDNAFGKYLSLPSLKDPSTAATIYTIMISERDPKYASGDASQEALWFSSGGTAGIPPVKYSLLSFDFKGDKPPACCSSVLFLPGITGSRLYRAHGAIEDKLWEPIQNSNIQELALNSDGSSVHGDIYTKVGGVVSAIYNLPTLKVYSSFFDQMNDLKSAGTITDFEAIPYDWRLSFDDILGKGAEANGRIFYSEATSTPYIIQELKHLAASSKTGKVTIVAHSMGGLVTKELIRRLGDTEAQKYIDNVILVASPQIGTPRAIPSMLHGLGQGITIGPYVILNEAGSRTFTANAPGAYALLPSPAYFSSVQTPTVKFPDSSVSFNKEIRSFGTTIDTTQEFFDFLTNSEERPVPDPNDVESASVLNSDLLNGTQQLHQNIDSWVPPLGINIIQIAGWGGDTMSGIEYYFGKRKQCFSGVGVTQTINGTDQCVGPEVRPVFTSDGDGTVVVPSALYISTSTPNVSRYWVNLHKYNKGTNTNRNHGNIFEVSQLLSFIQNLITKNQTNFPQFISTTPPPSFENEKSHLRFRLHSPLRIDLYDENGSHTGIATTTAPSADIRQVDSNISNSYYFELGDSKYLGVGSDANTSIFMNGYAEGTFDFDLDEMNGENVGASTSFSEVPTLPTTIVHMTIGSTLASASTLDVDSDGDGTTDFFLQPVSGEIVIYKPPTLPISPEDSSAQSILPTPAAGGGGPIFQPPTPMKEGTVLGTSTKQVHIEKPLPKVAVLASTPKHQVTKEFKNSASSTNESVKVVPTPNKSWYEMFINIFNNFLKKYKTADIIRKVMF